MASGAAGNPKGLSPETVESILRETIGLKDSLVRVDEARDVGHGDVAAREVIAAVNGQLPEGLVAGSMVEVEGRGIAATIVSVDETCDDVEPERISSLASNLKKSLACDSIVLELPQLWIISDPDFKAKTASIGLYPGGFWMGFLKSWGAVQMAEVFFRKSQKEPEPMVSLAVKFKDRECLKMCFTFLYDRYLVHPKQKNALRLPWCRLVSFEDFKVEALSGDAQPDIAKAAPSPKASPPQPEKALSKGPGVTLPRPAWTNVAEAPSKPTSGESSDRQWTPAEAMKSLSGKQLEAFQMVMSRMERLERENQELMQILLQMQGLLTQQQERNDRLTAMAGSGASAPQGGLVPGNTARLALEAQRHALAASQASTHHMCSSVQGPPPMQMVGQFGVPMPPPAPRRSALRTPGEVPTPPPPPRSDPESGGAALAEEDAEAASGGAEAPWKRQRRRPRKNAASGGDTEPGATESGGDIPPEGSSAEMEASAAPAASVGEAEQDSPGLAAYHNALLGV
ncbi:unnamed protein product [Polarella glacialis]|uniref:Uncharacterized protein n=2 Tax=Polarella glacialis TaxID=89957 RepID=A0A813G310_POLGL|nr:unnamed protein product [Polarella glacialis]